MKDLSDTHNFKTKLALHTPNSTSKCSAVARLKKNNHSFAHIYAVPWLAQARRNKYKYNIV